MCYFTKAIRTLSLRYKEVKVICMSSKYFSALLAALIVLSGCASEIPLTEESDTSSSTASDDSTAAMESSESLSVSTYANQSLGITIRSEAFDLHKLRTEGHKIILDDLESPGIGEMSVYSLEKGQTIESAILKLVSISLVINRLNLIFERFPSEYFSFIHETF